MYLDPKTPEEKKLYVIDFTTELEPGDDAIVSFTFTQQTGSASLAASQVFDKVIWLTLQGGTNTQVCTFDLKITTRLGQFLTREISIYVIDAGQAPYTSVTKGEIIEAAYEEMGLANALEFDITDPEKAMALRRLTALMNQWAARGMNLGYNDVGSSGVFTEISGIPDFAKDTVAIALAFRLAPTMGKTMSSESKKELQAGMQQIRAYCARIPERVLQAGTPRGSGNRLTRFWGPYAR